MKSLKSKLNKHEMIPIWVVEGYLLFTLIFYFVGPIKWKINNPLQLTTMTLAYFTSLYIGYRNGIKRNRISIDSLVRQRRLTKKSLALLLYRASCIYIICASLISVLSYGQLSFSLSAISNMAKVYQYRIHSGVQGRWYNLVVNMLGVLGTFYLPIGAIWWKQLSLADKLLYGIAIYFAIIKEASMGTMVGIGNLVFLMIPVFLYLFLTKYYKEKNNAEESGKSTRVAGKKARRMLEKLAIAGIVFVMFFVFVQGQRRANNSQTGMYSINPSNAKFIEELQEYPMSGVLAAIEHYTSGAYTGMAYGLQLPPKWTYGIGFSRHASNSFAQAGIVDVRPYTYPERIEQATGWPNGMFWPTAFSWFASDWTYPGVIFLMYLIGRLYAYTWSVFIRKQSVLDLALLSQLTLGIVFLPANNQLFQASDMFYATMCLLLGCFCMHITGHKRIV